MQTLITHDNLDIANEDSTSFLFCLFRICNNFFDEKISFSLYLVLYVCMHALHVTLTVSDFGFEVLMYEVVTNT